MPEFLVKIPKEKTETFLKVVGKMEYAFVKDAKKNTVLKSARRINATKKKKFTPGQLKFAKEIWEGLQEVEQSLQGKIKLKRWDELYKELNEK